MKYIQPLNESLNKIYIVVHQEDNNSDFFKSKYIHMDDTKYFSTYEKACDYVIKYLNKYHGQKFEPMTEDDGTRLFIKFKDNPDVKRALKYCKDIIDNNIYIKEITVE